MSQKEYHHIETFGIHENIKEWNIFMVCILVVLIICCVKIMHDGCKKEKQVVTHNPLLFHSQTYCKISLWIIRAVQVLMLMCLVQFFGEIYYISVPESFLEIYKFYIQSKFARCKTYGIEQQSDMPVYKIVFMYFMLLKFVINLELIYLLIIMQVIEWYTMLNLIRYQNTRTLGEITYQTLNQPVDPKLRQSTFRAQEKRLNLIFKIILIVIPVAFIATGMVDSKESFWISFIMLVILVELTCSRFAVSQQLPKEDITLPTREIKRT